MKVLLIFPSKLPATGNVSTAARIQKYLLSEGITCIVKDANAVSVDGLPCPRHQLCRFVSQEEVNGILFLHAFKSAKIVLCTCAKDAESHCEQAFPIPYGVIFGGTDLNLDVSDPEKFSSMQKVLKGSSFSVAFTEALKQKGIGLYSDLKVYVQPQGIEVPEFNGSLKDPNDNILENFNGARKFYTFLMVTGIRPVKDPMYILESWMELCKNNEDLNMKLIIIGPVLDQEYEKRFFQLLKSLKMPDASKPVPQCLRDLLLWMNNESAFPILYSPPLSSDSLKELLSSNQIFASINSSISEGMASSVLESMAHKIPVIARDNDGNRAVIRDDETGLLFHTPDDFAKQAMKLINTNGLRRSITENALESILKYHSPAVERRFYGDLCRSYFCREQRRDVFKPQ